MNICILDDYQNAIESLACFKMLEGQNVTILHQGEKDPKKLSLLLQDAEIIILTRERTQINDALLSRLPHLKLISQTGKISNHLNLADCTRRGIPVAQGIGSPIAPAELTWALLMNTVRKIPQAIRGMKAGYWQVNVGDTINGKILGIWGYGKIGKRIAQYAKAFGAEVLVWGSASSRNNAVEDGFGASASKSSFFKTADIITLHLRLNDVTHGMIKQQDIMGMKENATLINTSRAEIIEEGALIQVLKTGKNIKVGIDVYEQEPIYDKDYELLTMDNVVCTPHIGYVEKSSYELYFGKAFENVINFIKNKPTNIVNPEILPG